MAYGDEMRVLEKDIEELVAELGFEMVTFERAGGSRRPLLRLRIDRMGVESGDSGVTVDDCARVSRALEAYLDSREEVPTRSIVEVSSPGVERPLVRPGDYSRFAGQRVLLQGYEPLLGGQKRVEGLLIGLADSESEVEVDVAGERLRVPVASIAKANLVYDWEADLRG
jgi:ribosome maturation factor RimP